ncbi:WhiB family transcriptional regulator [Streptomyces sp. NPDC055109]
MKAGSLAWHVNAACAHRDVDPDLFYLQDRSKRGSQHTWAHPAKEVCHRCPVTRTCLESALDSKENTGIWGGLTAAERYKIGGPRPPRYRD